VDADEAVDVDGAVDAEPALDVDAPPQPASTALTRTKAVEIAAFQELMAQTYGERDEERGRPATIAWLAEEVGELAQAVRKGDRATQIHELGDVLAWLASLANQLGISLDEAVGRYAVGCPLCGGRPCVCPPQ
jgi:NTP pyrophosphatase (non-canonical NTP hydrolase)